MSVTILYWSKQFQPMQIQGEGTPAGPPKKKGGEGTLLPSLKRKHLAYFAAIFNLPPESIY